MTPDYRLEGCVVCGIVRFRIITAIMTRAMLQTNPVWISSTAIWPVTCDDCSDVAEEQVPDDGDATATDGDAAEKLEGSEGTLAAPDPQP